MSFKKSDYTGQQGETQTQDAANENGSIVPKPKLSWQQVTREAMGFDPQACPCCMTGRMHTIRFFAANAPPHASAASLTKIQVD